MDNTNDNASADTSGSINKLRASRDETRAAFETRALMYAYLYDELAEEIGPKRTASAMKRAIHRRGLEIGEAYREAAARGDLAKVARIFVECSPCEGSLFFPDIAEPASDGRIVLEMRGCPLVDAWEHAGYDAEQVDRLCEIASAVDEGTFERAGLGLRFLSRKACPESERCLLELRLRAKEASSMCP
ncbi:MAG: L-2-amino-thiazoline-4-carboxylic acid hydrolase [Coriobacteriia bacterium]|nr:L-2-amino-thiazoline-4-carboxylic acid hydrolase [Coriobacteriia bacterium]